MQILSEFLLQYINNHNKFYTKYCHVFEDTPRITCHFPELQELKHR